MHEKINVVKNTKVFQDNLYKRKKIWGEDSYFTIRSMDVFITKLRKYLKDDPAIEIVNIHGSGFILTVNQETLAINLTGFQNLLV